MTTVSDADFNMYPPDEAIRLKKMFDVVTKLNLWEWFISFSPDENTGCIFSKYPEIGLIYKQVANDGHNHNSFVYCIMQMNTIAKIGLDEYYKLAKP